MSLPNIQQKKVKPGLKEGDDISKVLGRGDEIQFFYQAAHPKTLEIYKQGRMTYRNTADEDAEEMFMDRIVTPDGDFIVDRQVVVMVRQLNPDGNEVLKIQEHLVGKSPLGNPHRYSKQEGLSEHDEPDIEQRMIPGSGESIRKRGESVLHHNTVFDIPFDENNVAECMKRVKYPNSLQLYAREQGQRGWRIRDKKVWSNYSWDDLMTYCKTKKTPEMTQASVLDFAARNKDILTPQQKLNLMIALGVLPPEAAIQPAPVPVADESPKAEKVVKTKN
jgi:hypothetical protein